MARADGRLPNELRPVRMTRQYTKFAPGAVLMELGDTKVLVTATIEERTPRHITDDSGWLTAEYALLPGSTHTRAQRERVRVSGRTHEIQRLIGRSLRACIDLPKLGDRTITIDADVIQADGGTRTASITGGYIALMDAVSHLQREGLLKENPIITPVAAISVGILNGMPVLDLDYSEDSTADIDANLVMTEKGDIIEFQATSERAPLSRAGMEELLNLGEQGIRDLIGFQKEALALFEAVEQPV